MQATVAELQLCYLMLAAGSMKVMATLMVVGIMDAARDDILGDNNIILTPIESVSQVCYPVHDRGFHCLVANSTCKCCDEASTFHAPCVCLTDRQTSSSFAGDVLFRPALHSEVGGGSSGGECAGGPLQYAQETGRPLS